MCSTNYFKCSTKCSKCSTKCSKCSTTAPPQQQQAMIFQHPFTMTVSGPTSCGKTTWIKKLLQNVLIKPAPTRIIWLYRRWQPLYDELRNTVRPLIEFIQGIPLTLADDNFVPTRDNNLIVLDDLMSTASKDTRITELFTVASLILSPEILAEIDHKGPNWTFLTLKMTFRVIPYLSYLRAGLVSQQRSYMMQYIWAALRYY